ncbi:hypothetical protein HY947_06700 [Candidatus Gottesmanbacteria bacterium]|nr:hypothetical protein [Candidatus Gottesmanbacteria bacterium]
MKDIRIIARPVVGSATADQWGQALLSQNVYGVIEIQSDEAMKRGIEILSLLDRRLQGVPSDPGAISLIIQEIVDETVVSLVLLVVKESVASMVCYGKGALYLRRNTHFAPILSGPGAICGKIEDGDVCLLLTNGASAVFPRSRVVSLVDGSIYSVIAERMILSWHQEGGGLGGAALVLGVISGDGSEDRGDGNTPAMEAGSVSEDFGSTKIEMTQKKRFTDALIPLFKSIFRDIRLRFVALPLSSRKRVILATVLSLLFLFSVGIGLRRQMTDQRFQETTKRMQDAKRTFEEGVALAEVNPPKGRDELLKAKESITLALSSARPRSKEFMDSTELSRQIEEAILGASHTYAIEPALFYDASLLRGDGEISTFSLEGDVALLLDIKAKSLMTLSLSSKSAQILAGGQALSAGLLVARHGDSGYIFSPDAIAVIDLKTKAITQGIIKKTEDWGTIVSMTSYGGNIYLLDSQKGRIWKYVATDTGFSEIREYLNPDTLPDFSGALGIAIDGSVWVGTNTGGIFRFTQGKENTFTPQGVDPKFSGQIRVYTNDDLKRVYVLDASQKRVVVLEKDGVYAAQYEWKTSLSPVDMAVSEEQRKILLLSDGKIFSVDLR